MSLLKGDMVMLIAGKDKGKTGRIISINKKRDTVLVEKLNLVKRHQKPTQTERQGGIVEKEAPIHRSNVMFYDEKAAKPTRLGIKLSKDGKKVRYSKRSGDEIAASK